MLLLTRPDHDRTTRYISTWAKQILDWAKARPLTVNSLDGNRAVRKTLESMVKKHTPSFIFLNGHGSNDTVYGQDNEPLVQAGKNESVLSGSVTYALSCSSAKELGPVAVAAGAKAYVGFKEDFVFMYEEESRVHPERDKTAALFLDPSNSIALSLLKGHNVRKSVEHGKRQLAKNAQSLLTSQSDPDSVSALRYLLWDFQGLTFLGDGEAAIV